MVVGATEDDGLMKVLVTGSTGQLGIDVVARLADDHEVTPLSHGRLDISDLAAVRDAMDAIRPDVVVNCAAWTAVDECEADPERAFRVNASGPANLFEAARKRGARIVQISTDYVFDGTKATPYLEGDTPNPLSVYGQSKLAGEQALGPEATIVRTSWIVGPNGRNMLKTILSLLEGGGILRFVDDQRGCPTFSGDLAQAIGFFVEGHFPGVFHITNANPVSWYGFACEVAEAASADPSKVRPITTSDLVPPRPAPRPANSVLKNTMLPTLGLSLLRDHRDALHELFAHGLLEGPK
jgi:dTDP-4-dehydrorhamnose reductase